MHITSVEDLVAAAQQQPTAQRLLLVFVKTRLQKDHTAEERVRFERGEGGTLQPLFCVDFGATQMPAFPELSRQADQMSDEWDKVLIGCIDEPISPGDEVVDTTLKMLVARIESGGDLRGLLCFGRDGAPIVFE